MTVEKTLEDRDKVHGDFKSVAVVADALRSVLQPRRLGMTPVMSESITMICTKLSRIVCGDPFHADHWHDIAGYAMLVERYLKETEND